MNFHGGLFTEKELERMASPERLDLLVSITDRRGWIALGALALLLVQFTIWAVFGSLTLTVKGEGILINGGLKIVETPNDGRVFELKKKAGDHVRENDVLALIETPKEVAELKLDMERLNTLKAARESAGRFETTARDAQLQALTQEALRLPDSIKSARESVSTKITELRQAQVNVRQGFITESVVSEARDRLRQAEEELKRFELREVQIPGERERLNMDEARARLERDKEIDILEQKIAAMKFWMVPVGKEPWGGRKIVSATTGRVVEVVVDVTNLVSVKDKLMTIEPLGSDMDAIVYVPAEEAKKIDLSNVPKNGRVPARISPSNVKVEEMGYITGRVTGVQMFPASREGIQQRLRNTALVEKLMKDGPPIEVAAKLDRGVTPSGLRWSSSNGPKSMIVTGTLCNGEFEVSRRAPISYVLPMLHKWTGL